MYIGRTSRVLPYDLTGYALFDIGRPKWKIETKDLQRKWRIPSEREPGT